MSGYLARLAARAVGEPASVSPRLPSRFEPTAERPGAPLDELPTGESLGARAGPPRRDGRGETESATEAGARRGARLRPTTDAREPTPRAPTLPGPPPPGATDTSGPRTTVAVPAAAEHAGGPEPAPTGSATPAPAAQVTTQVSAQVSAQVTGQAARVEAEPVLGEARPPSPSPRGSEPPVVRVSIGRVEVRAAIAAPQAAAPSSQPAPAAAPADPVLSLHDYLGGRRGSR